MGTLNTKNVANKEIFKIFVSLVLFGSRKMFHLSFYTTMCLFDCLMVLNTTFNNISVISWRSVLLVEEIGVSGENH